MLLELTKIPCQVRVNMQSSYCLGHMPCALLEGHVLAGSSSFENVLPLKLIGDALDHSGLCNSHGKISVLSMYLSLSRIPTILDCVQVHGIRNPSEMQLNRDNMTQDVNLKTLKNT